MELETALLNLTTMGQGPTWTEDTERDKKANETVANLRTHLEQNRIFFSADLCNNIEKILSDSKEIVLGVYKTKSDQQFNDRANKRRNYLTTEELLEPTHMWRKLHKTVQTELREARLNLAGEFRKLIGVE